MADRGRQEWARSPSAKLVCTSDCHCCIHEGLVASSFVAPVTPAVSPHNPDCNQIGIDLTRTPQSRFGTTQGALEPSHQVPRQSTAPAGLLIPSRRSSNQHRRRRPRLQLLDSRNHHGEQPDRAMIDRHPSSRRPDDTSARREPRARSAATRRTQSPKCARPRSRIFRPRSFCFHEPPATSSAGWSGALASASGRRLSEAAAPAS